MKNKAIIVLFIIVVIILFCFAGMFDTELLQAGMIH